MRGEADSLQLLKGDQPGHGRLSLGRKVHSYVSLYLQNLKAKEVKAKQGEAVCVGQGQ